MFFLLGNKRVNGVTTHANLMYDNCVEVLYLSRMSLDSFKVYTVNMIRYDTCLFQCAVHLIVFFYNYAPTFY